MHPGGGETWGKDSGISGAVHYRIYLRRPIYAGCTLEGCKAGSAAGRGVYQGKGYACVRGGAAVCGRKAL